MPAVMLRSARFLAAVAGRDGQDRQEKTAVAGGPVSGLSNAYLTTLGASAGLGILAGSPVGYLAARARERPADPSVVRESELQRAYDQQIETIRRNRQLRLQKLMARRRPQFR